MTLEEYLIKIDTLEEEYNNARFELEDLFIEENKKFTIGDRVRVTMPLEIWEGTIKSYELGERGEISYYAYSKEINTNKIKTLLLNPKDVSNGITLELI